MAKEDYWPTRCTFIGCTNPTLRTHHHHMHRGYILNLVCQCDKIDQPGTKPKKEETTNDKRKGFV